MADSKERGNAYYAVRHIYDHSPGRSWQRLNHALRATLKAAITAHLSFLPDDFAAMCSNMSGHYWMGNSCGSICGEALYCHMVEVGHTPACISFEKYAERPAALWAWDVKTPARLCIGSEFHWQGRKVTVTNMKEDRLIACSYRQNQNWKAPAVGDFTYFSGGDREIKSMKKSGKGMLVGFGPVVENHKDDRKPEKIFTISYNDLADRRKAYDQATKEFLAAIAEAKDEVDLKAARSRTPINGKPAEFRPCDIEAIKSAIAKKRESFKVSA